ncbi:MAG: hypothetical protein IIB31_08750, partial [Chloroflexi bacterium]|nr:hypothetical protein [Chloroflexota bacterium]
SDPMGPPKIGLSAGLDALAAYVSSLTAIPLSPHRDPDGTLTPDAQVGKLIFEARNCQSCHSGDFFTDVQRHDVGTIQPSSGLGIGQPLAGIGFDTPSLIGIWDTPPYLHNGQAATLQDVLSNPSHGNTSGLTPAETDQLVAYLLQINAVDTTPPTVSITSPADGAVLTAGSVTVTGAASDDTGLSQVELRVGTGAWQQATGTSSWSSPVTLTPGVNTVTARATDTAGNFTDTVITVTYNPADTTPPTVSITSPADGAVLTAGSVTVTGAASDDTGLSQVELRVGTGAWQQATGTSSWSAPVTLTPGVNTVTARATDTAGNFTDTVITVTYNPPPTSQIITNIVVSNGKVYTRDTLDVGQVVYIDRTYTFNAIPTAYLGQEFIRTANNDKKVTDPNHLSFDLTVAATVYVAFDVRASVLPAWLESTWVLTGDIIGTTDVSRRVYRKDFVSGTVILGGNGMAPMQGAGSNYNVFAIAR